MPGHVVIPELNWNAYQDKLQRIELKSSIAKLANLAISNIVFDEEERRPV